MADKFALFVRDDEACKKQKPITRLVLYALAARANEKGYCWPSVEQVMGDTGLCRASIFRALTEIRDILTVDAPGYKKSNSYIFPWQGKAEAAIERKKANNRARAVAQEAEGTPADAGVGKTRKLSTKGEKVVDKSLSQRLKQSHKETGSLSQRPQGSLTETGGGLSQRPEEYSRRIQEESLSLLLSQNEAKTGKAVDNSKGKATEGAAGGKTQGGEDYDGTRKPRTREELERIKQWCKIGGLDDFRTKDFIRINRLARWSRVGGETTVCDLIADFVFKWRKEDPTGYWEYTDKRKGVRRG